MSNDKELVNVEREVFDNSWFRIYKILFNTKEIKDKLADNTIMQVIVWNRKYKQFYPSYPIYYPQKSNTIHKYKDRYINYIKGNYDSFTFAKFIQKNNITKDIHLILNSKKEIEITDSCVYIYIYENSDIAKLVEDISHSFKSQKPSIRALSIYIQKLYEILDIFNFRSVVFKSIINRQKEVIGVVSIFSQIENYNTKELYEIKKIVTKKIIEFNENVIKAKKRIQQENSLIKKQEIREKNIKIKNVVSSIMSRNISHNIGSHVLVNVENIMENTPIIEHKKLINYILERMNFITQVSTLWSPQWSLPKFFKREIIQQFLEQRHILYNIVTTDGLSYIDNLKYSDYYIISKPNINKGHSFKIVPIYQERDLSQIEDDSYDILVDIPGGKIGYHALYTIIENILRNSAKYGFATLSNRFQKKEMELNIHIKEEKNDHKHRVQIWDNVSYISNLKFSFDTKDINQKDITILSPIEKVENEPFILIKLKIKDKEISIYVHLITSSPQNNTWLMTPTLNFNYEEKLKDENNFFVSEARFHSILKNLSSHSYNMYAKENNLSLLKRSEDILKNENLLNFVKLATRRVFHPLHLSINSFLREQLTYTEKDLNKNNGLSEIKICALYLSGESFNDLSSEDYKKNNKDREYIKAIAKPDYDKYGNLLCYRLGYEFILKKPTVYSLYLSCNFRNRLPFIESCSDDSFILVKGECNRKSNLRKSHKIISSEFLIFDFEQFERILSKKDKNNNPYSDEVLIDKLNELPYRIIVLIDKEYSKDRLERIFKQRDITITKNLKKRVAYLEISECRDKDIFKEKILNTWKNHLLNLNRYNTLEVSINLNGKESMYYNIDITSIAKELLEKFGDKLIKNSLIDKSDKKDVLYIINSQLKSILYDTKLYNLFKTDTLKYPNMDYDLNEIRFILKGVENPSFKDEAIVLSRHIDKKDIAKEEAQITKPILYYEALSGGTNQFWLYKYMFKDTQNKNEILFNKLKLLETTLYKIAIFDERLNDTIDTKRANEQNLYIINEINGYEISTSEYGLIGEFKDNILTLKQKKNQKNIDIDILIVHYGLIEKIKDNSKLSYIELQKFLSSFSMVVVTSGRGIILDSSLKKGNIDINRRKDEYIKFISFPVLKEYFKSNSINKIGLTQMLMNLIGIKNTLSGLYDE